MISVTPARLARAGQSFIGKRMSRVRDTVLASLSAIGARSEASFYADQFADLAPERFALLVIDPRSLHAPLLEAFISNLRLLSDLELTPIIVLGVLDEDHTHVRFQSQKLTRQLTDVGVSSVRLNTATYGLISEVRKTCHSGRIPILEVTDTRNRLDLGDLIETLLPDKVIFLQPSGGLSRHGRRISVINVDHDQTEDYTQSIGQSQFVDLVKQLLRDVDTQTHYVMASPLNLIAELFTEKGSGTLIRRGAHIKEYKTYRALDLDVLEHSLEVSFGRRLRSDFFKGGIKRIFIEKNYRSGIILKSVDDLTYMSKFWVRREARGEGIARDLWNALSVENTKFFWRSRSDNPFNDWYTRRCDGMQRLDGWTVFWVGLSVSQVRRAIEHAQNLPEDFKASLPPVEVDS